MQTVKVAQRCCETVEGWTLLVGTADVDAGGGCGGVGSDVTGERIARLTERREGSLAE